MKRTTFITVIIIIIALISAVVVLYIYRDAAYTQLNNWDLIPRPETFTELYFDNASSLPRATVAGQPVSFAFTIHNVEGTTTVYTYIVYFQGDDGSRTIFTGDNVSLASDASTTISVAHTFPTSNEQGEVVVDLPALNQQIDFLLPDTN